MKRIASIIMLALTPCLACAQDAPPIQAEAPVPACLSERTEVERLKEANATLQMQIMQFQFPQIKKLADDARIEKERLQELLPKQEGKE